MTKSNKGFSAVGLIGLLLIFAIVAAVGYYVYKSQNDDVAYDSNAQVAEVTKEENSSTPPDQIQYDNFVIVFQEDGSSTVVSPDKVAKTQDQIDILLALRNYCRSAEADLVAVNYRVFDNNDLFVIKNDRAWISAANCTDETSDGTGGARHHLYKNSQGIWYYHFGSQEMPACSEVDGWGYPKEIIAECMEMDFTTRSPR